MKTTPALRRRARRIADGLAELYPDAQCALNHQSPLQLLIATILSAQCTDVRVNMVTPALFARYKSAHDFAAADPKELERMIASTGFFRNKAKNIILFLTIVAGPGRISHTLDELVKRPGVGRSRERGHQSAFGVPGITVDTSAGEAPTQAGRSRRPVRWS